MVPRFSGAVCTPLADFLQLCPTEHIGTIAKTVTSHQTVTGIYHNSPQLVLAAVQKAPSRIRTQVLGIFLITVTLCQTGIRVFRQLRTGGINAVARS